MNCVEPAPHLLAVDVGLRAGFAVYNHLGHLVSYHSHNFGAASRLRRAAPSMLHNVSELAVLVLEGGGNLADPWARTAANMQLTVYEIGAERWREQLLYPREQRDGALAKEAADSFARRIITWSGAPQPTSLRHDAAEAIMIGLWGVLEVGWLPELPSELRR